LELDVRSRLHRLGYRFRVDYRLDPSLRVRGDIVFTRRKLVVFVDGCFWHGCPEHATAPKNNAEWWRAKLQANVERDGRNRAALQQLGWTVMQVWEHESASEATARIEAALRALAEPTRLNSL
jgi:DNA mismatch endonuclease (patch repair protein)